MADTITYVHDDVSKVGQALNRLGKIALIRKAVRPPARKGIREVVRALRVTAQRTHPLSMHRPTGKQSPRHPNQGSKRGPMSRFIGIANISSRSTFVGAKTFFDTRKFAGFVRVGKRTGKRAFYPAAQQYGAEGANPTIRPQNQVGKAVVMAQSAAGRTFEKEFAQNYDKVVAEAFRE